MAKSFVSDTLSEGQNGNFFGSRSFFHFGTEISKDMTGQGPTN
jgi:hypothetical protein